MITSINEFRQYLKENSSSMDTLMDILSRRDELNDLKQRRRDLEIDMENEAGQMGDQWTDEDANRYGALMNDLDEQIAAKEQELFDAEAKRYKQANDEDEPFYDDVLKQDLMNNVDYIKAYRAENPGATLDDEAKEYKKQFSFNSSIEEIKIALFDLEEDIENAKPNRRKRSHSFNEGAINETSVHPLPFLVIGKTIDEAKEIAIGYNAIVRETQANGESLIVTQELRPNRYNVATENGVITKVLNIG